ncbi:MAG: 1-(5-phosphoribosyl)-5-[(5-phosphoribosylamino)methylideneamino]imidazole-4-carboxamide isomerase [Candidatus Omnitrophica bacterium]|nr:1-(5-phosphoribosyl)-5-[(5-phosphoribosylamino)methylideneamino]imidazole-4-carboxamide isomerase [Candidatus Omnitrophota bacterium]
MIVVPAIDIKDGKVIRLAQGEFSRQTVYADSPVEMAKKWASYGVEMIHIVDLDGAREGCLKNLASVKEIIHAIKVDVELGGGMRDEGSIRQALDAGVSKVVIGTRALDERFLRKITAKFGEKIVVGIDANEGVVHTRGWLFKTDIKAVGLAKKMETLGVKTINYTDISRDGMLEGPNIDSLREILRVTKLDVIAAGGVSTIGDIKRLKKLEPEGLKGVIIGKALYEGRIDLKEAIEACLLKE